MTYRETLAHIFGLGRFGMKPGLERIDALLQSLGNPHEKVRAVNLVGTNGKGSTSVFLASIMSAGGYRVGLFTSPHLVSFTERFRINGREISEAEVVDLAARILAAAPPAATFFEIVTALALLWFAEQRVDLAVLEAGMGGGRDATAAAVGILSVVTPIDMDHCEYLGSSIEEIAVEKAGMIRHGRPVVISRQSDEVKEILLAEAQKAGSLCRCFGVDFSSEWQDGGLAYHGAGVRMQGLRPGIGGRYQSVNAAAALSAAETLSEDGFPLTEAALRRGIEKASWPGRMELIGESPRIILDCAHNPAGARALGDSLASVPHSRLILVAGVMSDKDVAGIIGPLAPLASEAIAVAPSIERSLPADMLASMLRDYGVTCSASASVAAGIDHACRIAGPEDLILVCGSIFTVGEARAYLTGSLSEPVRG